MSYKFFSNKECDFFPCHKQADKDKFNCLFCYCPLYSLGKNCGGNFEYTSGIKDCTNCLLPHLPQNYEIVTAKLTEMIMRGLDNELEPK